MLLVCEDQAMACRLTTFCCCLTVALQHLHSRLQQFKMNAAVNAVVHDTVLKYTLRHIASEDISGESKLRHASNDACGIEYSVTYTRAAGSADGAIAIRTEWPKKLADNLTLQNIMPRVVSTGPPGVELMSASNRTAIVAWLLTRKDKQMDDGVRAAAQWLASLRCETCCHWAQCGYARA